MSPHESEPTTFGIVAGLGMGAGIFYYRSLVNAQLARGLSPRILMVHADVRRVMAHAARRTKHGCSPPIWQDCSVNWQTEVPNSGPFLLSHLRFARRSWRR